MTKTNNRTYSVIVLPAVMAALVFVSSALRIPIPTAIGSTAIHFGNIFCLLSGMLMGGVKGGIASGLGSMVYDFTNPLYIAESPITFINKFAMGFVCGIVASIHKDDPHRFKWNLIGGICGSVAYVVLYVGKTFITNYFFLHATIEATLITCGEKGIVSLVNGLIAVICAVILYPIFKKAMDITVGSAN